MRDDAARATLEPSVSAEGDVEYYISGLYAGTWNVSVDGKSVGAFTAPAGSGLSTGKEWLDTLNNWVFNWSVSGSKNNMNEEMCINNIRAISGELFALNRLNIPKTRVYRQVFHISH